MCVSFYDVRADVWSLGVSLVCVCHSRDVRADVWSPGVSLVCVCHSMTSEQMSGV